MGGALTLTLQKPPRPSSTGAPSACLQISMSSAHTEGTDHFCMSLKEPPPLPDACLDATVAVLPAQALRAVKTATLSPLGEPVRLSLIAPILKEAVPDAVGVPQRRCCHRAA